MTAVQDNDCRAIGNWLISFWYHDELIVIEDEGCSHCRLEELRLHAALQDIPLGLVSSVVILSKEDELGFDIFIGYKPEEEA